MILKSYLADSSVVQGVQIELDVTNEFRAQPSPPPLDSLEFLGIPA